MIFQNIISERNRICISSCSPIPLLPSPRQCSNACYFYRCAYSGHFILVKSYWSFIYLAFYLLFQGLSLLQRVARFCSFLLPSNIPLYILHFKIHLSFDRHLHFLLFQTLPHLHQILPLPTPLWLFFQVITSAMHFARHGV